MSAPGFILLVHEHLHRAAELARHLAEFGPVVIHLDTRVAPGPLTALEGAGLRHPISLLSTRRGEWGMIGLVDATLDAAGVLLDGSEVSHVCLLSGSCLPTRPLAELVRFLDANPGTDFIESNAVGKADWIQGGLDAERFTLWFPLGWKRRRWLFDWLVEVQRRLRVRRRLPKGLMPHLGLQWWCLSAETLRTMLEHPELPRWRRFFAWTWIPDEGFFQTLVRHVARGRVVSQPLTLQRFDPAGRPFVFHDDHADLLTESSYFFARKIDPDADGLYARLLDPARAVRPGPCPACISVDEAPFHSARERAQAQGLGLLGPSRMAHGTMHSRVETAEPYAVLVSTDSAILRQIRSRHDDPSVRLHGHLFGVFPADLATDMPVRDGLGPGCLPTEPVQRDYRASQYLARVLWIGRDRRAAFLFDPKENRYVRGQILSDWNARLVLIGNGSELLEHLGEPLSNNAGRLMAPPPRRAWLKVLPPDSEDVADQALAALRSDWDAPEGWLLPQDGRYAL